MLLRCYIQVHQAIVLPLCHNLQDDVIPDDLREDPVLIFPETSASVLRAAVEYIYKGFSVVSGIRDWVQLYTILRSLGVPLSSSVRTIHQVKASAD